MIRMPLGALMGHFGPKGGTQGGAQGSPPKGLYKQRRGRLKTLTLATIHADNGMNLISESLTILTSAQLLVIFTFAHIFWRNFVFAGFWPILEHEMTRPVIEC